MKNLPKKIYLQLGEFRDDAEFLDTDFGELTGVTWADSDIDDYDQEYIHEDEVDRLRELVKAQKELIGDYELSLDGYTTGKSQQLINQIKELEK